MAPQNETPLDAPAQPEALDSWFLLETGEPMLSEEGGRLGIAAGRMAVEVPPAELGR